MVFVWPSVESCFYMPVPKKNSQPVLTGGLAFLVASGIGFLYVATRIYERKEFNED